LLQQITRNTLKRNPGLKIQLKQAGIDQNVDDFIKKSLFNSSIFGGMFFVISIVVMIAFGFSVWTALLMLVALVSPLFIYNYIIKSPFLKLKIKQKQIDAEVVFVGRFLLIELSSGVPLYTAISNASEGFSELSNELKRIIRKVSLGTPIDAALEDTIKSTPSPYFRKLLWQILNALGTGADLAQALQATLKQITAEQVVDMREYGRRLNPVVMFYLMLTVVVPSLGIVVIVILSMFMSSLGIGVNLLVMTGIIVGLAQLFFLLYIKNTRPGVSI
jgi:pilus assembly protein TadC